MHVPGVKPEEIVVEAAPDSLKVSVNQQAPDESGRTYQREKVIRPWSRLFEFPMEIDPDKVQATLEYGILKIRATKALGSQPRIILITESETAA